MPAKARLTDGLWRLAECYIMSDEVHWAFEPGSYLVFIHPQVGGH